MLQDQYGNALSTTSAAARDAYVEGVDLFLAAQAGVDDAYDRAIAEDPGFAMAHTAKSRQAQMRGDRETLTKHLAEAKAARNVTASEAAHINALGLLMEGRGPEAYKAIRAHLVDHPRDVLVTQTCVGVFGLIGFSGQPGREAEQLAFTTQLLPHYGDDWWFLGGHAFAQVEAGQTAKAAETVERSLATRPENANSAHYKAHIHYEAGETEAGLGYMAQWRDDHYTGKQGLLHCHVSWHVALWALEQGDTDRMWAEIDRHIRPGDGHGPAINLLTDTAAIYYRAEMAGVPVPAERWQDLSAFAAEFFPKPGIAFVDVHAALAHAMAGNTDALEKVRDDARGPAGDLVCTLADAFGALARQDWAQATTLLSRAMADHERIGGSRAQRDLLEFALLNAMLKQGQAAEAHLMLTTRRPVHADAHPVAGL
ncbi:MAG: tetratricopeptide repeat protein [Pseudomonadota bacterium]